MHIEQFYTTYLLSYDSLDCQHRKQRRDIQHCRDLSLTLTIVTSTKGGHVFKHTIVGLFVNDNE